MPALAITALLASSGCLAIEEESSDDADSAADGKSDVGGSPSQLSIETAITAEMKRVDDAYNSHSIPPNTAPDVHFMTPPDGFSPSAMIIGQETYEAVITGFLAAQPGFTHTSTVRSVHVITSRAAVADVDVTVAGLRTPDGQEIPAAVMPVSVTWRQQYGEWLATDIRFLAPVTLTR